MANRHFYFAFENVAMTNPDWLDLVERYRQRGSANESDQPAERNHQRDRPDGEAIIYEALFNEAAVSPVAVRGVLASVTGVTPPNISFNTVTGDTNVTTYTILGTDSLIQRVFGGDDATWSESRLEATAYLEEYKDDWD